MRSFLRQIPAALRVLLLLSIVLGVIYPLAITALAQIPGLQSRADGSLLNRGGKVVGSSLIGQDFKNERTYFQGRPAAAGDGYDPTATGASNLGPESIVGTDSLLSQVCGRSYAIGKRYGVDGSRPFCTADGVGAVLAVFHTGPGYDGAVTKAISINQPCPAKPFITSYKGAPVFCAVKGVYAKAQIVPIRGSAPAHPVVPADAVTASGSGLDPNISPAYAKLQEASVAQARGITFTQVAAIVDRCTYGRDLGFFGEPRVNVLQVNLALDRSYPR
jgi:potassium-transporting ATPase KdpC subunit